jgi:TolB-like protein/Tfp pilus assembly protein PilF
MANPQSLHLHFGEYEIDLAAFELRRGGQPCAVEPQVLELLAYLVRNAGRLATKADLIEHVWDGRIVSDSTLASRVKSARRAIGDDGEQQRLIKTVHSRGVRFVGEVRVEARPADADAGEPGKAPAAPALGIAGVAGDLPSIAVLPFANIGGNPELSYLIDGLSEDIITDLSRFRQLRVIARDSCFRHRDAGTDLRAAAQSLGADYVVTGSVRRQGARLRLSAQLTAADSRNELWAERFDRSTEDVFAATDELVRTIVGTLAGRVRAALAKRKPPANFAAYDCVLRAQAALTKIGDLGEEAEAQRLFEEALACDPFYPRAHAGLAIVLLRHWFRGNDDPAIERALHHAQRAVAIDSDDNECQETLGWVLLHRRAFDLSERHYRRAVELNPNSPDELAAMGSACSYFGRPEEGIGWFELTKKVDPFFDPSWYWNLLGATYFNARRYEDALAAFARNAAPPVWVRAYGAAAQALAGRTCAARVLAAKIALDAPDFSAADLMRKEPYKVTADREHLAAGLRLAGLLPASADAPAPEAAALSARQAPPTTSTQAHQYYLMGRSFLISGGWGKRALEVARQMFVKAIEADPSFALAYAALATCDCKRLLMEVESVSFQTIAAYSERALALQPGLCEAYAAKGMAHYAAGECAEADAAFELAIAGGPHCFEAHFFYGRHCLAEQRHEQAAQLLERAAELNQNDYGALGLLDDCYRRLGRCDEARDAARRCLDRVTAEVTAHPDNANALAFGAIIATELGEDARALDWAGRAIAIDPHDLVVNYNVACTYAGLGELERAVSRLHHAIPDDRVCQRAFTAWMKMDISLDPLRPLPEFQRLMHDLEHAFPDQEPKAIPLLQSA